MTNEDKKICYLLETDSGAYLFTSEKPVHLKLKAEAFRVADYLGYTHYVELVTMKYLSSSVKIKPSSTKPIPKKYRLTEVLKGIFGGEFTNGTH